MMKSLKPDVDDNNKTRTLTANSLTNNAPSSPARQPVRTDRSKLSKTTAADKVLGPFAAGLVNLAVLVESFCLLACSLKLGRD